MKLFWKKMLFKDPEPDVLLVEIRKVCEKLDLANRRFSMESDPDLIESCIYEQEALRARYRHLLKEARNQSLSAPVVGLEDTDTPGANAG